MAWPGAADPGTAARRSGARQHRSVRSPRAERAAPRFSFGAGGASARARHAGATAFVVCVLATFAAGCKADRPPTPADTPHTCADFQWLLGTWQTQDGNTQNVERWTHDDTGVLRGDSVTRAEGQVVYTESLRIASGPVGLEYRAEPQDQPPNVFRLEMCGETWARFSDPAHDWPQSIHYTRTDDTLTATVSGTSNGKERTETWSWTLARSGSATSAP